MKIPSIQEQELAKSLARHWYWWGAALLVGLALLNIAQLLLVRIPQRDTLRSSVVTAEADREQQQRAGAAAAAALKSLPAQDRSGEFLAALLRESVKARVDARDIEVQPNADSKTPVFQVRVAAKLVGGYADLKRTIANALEYEPSAALDSVAISRLPETQGIEAQVKWTVYSRSAGGP